MTIDGKSPALSSSTVVAASGTTCAQCALPQRCTALAELLSSPLASSISPFPLLPLARHIFIAGRQYPTAAKGAEGLSRGLHS